MLHTDVWETRPGPGHTAGLEWMKAHLLRIGLDAKLADSGTPGAVAWPLQRVGVVWRIGGW